MVVRQFPSRYALLTMLVGSVLALFLFGCQAMAEGVSPTDPAWQEAVDAAIRNYIYAHPEVIVESLRAMEAKQQETEQADRHKKIAARQADLLHDAMSPASGNPTGDVTVVEFFDYRCGFCKRVAGAVTQLQKDDGNVRVVYKDFPILGELSIFAAKAALAARNQGKHQVFHEALLDSHNELTRDALFAIAARVGLDADQLQKDMESPDIQATLDRTRLLGNELGITGTPAFIIGADFRPGALELKELKDLIARARVR